jgi:multidrug resistance efflux pump
MPGQWKWFNPQGILRLLYVLFYPLKYVLWAIVPLVTIAGLSMLNNIDELIEDLGIILTDVSSITQFAVGLFIANLASRVAQGVAIVAHGGKVPGFGIALVLGVLPRFYIDKRAIAELDRKGQLWGHGSPLLARLMTFALGILIWATTRETGTFLPQVALIAAQFGLIMFVATSWPLMLSDGMRWLSTYLNEPKLVPKALMAFKHVFFRSPLPPMMSKKDVPALIFFAIGSILSMTLILSVMGLGALVFLESTLDGLGVLIFMGMVVAFTVWVLALWASVTAQGKAKGNFNKEAFRQFTQGTKPTADAMPDLDGLDEEALPSKAKVVWGVILVVLLVLAFQPYQYDAGGEVVILPVSKAQAIARAEGEIIEVMVAEGDQVSRGQVLAQLSSWDQERQVAVTRTDLNAAEANLARLIEGASPEEIEVARRQVTSAEASLAFSQAEYDRAEELLASGTVSRAAFEQAQSQLATDIAGLEVAQASLDLVLAEASANDIAIAQSEVDRLTLELQFQRDELERTRVVAPMEGRIVTANLQLLIGKYLRSGDPLLEIENAQIVTAEIAVPESDIALIGAGDTVRLRVTGHADTEILGEVQTIAPAAEDEGYGSIVRVAAIFENETDFLRSGMTGYAKIDGAEMRAWEAYLRSIRRFFQIEVWSWIP